MDFALLYLQLKKQADQLYEHVNNNAGKMDDKARELADLIEATAAELRRVCDGNA